MKSAKSIRRKSSVSGPFTPTGKRGSCHRHARWRGSCHRHARWIAAAAGSLLAAPLQAQPQTGSTSSASVGISVSVAPSFRLKPSEETAQNGVGYCIETNGEQLSLPVLLVDPSGDQPSASGSGSLPWCGTGQTEPQDNAKTLKPAGLLIIRPE